jgi:hypothetical protein
MSVSYTAPKPKISYSLNSISCCLKVKCQPITGTDGSERERVEVQLHTFSTSTLGGGGWRSAPRPSRITPGKNPVPIVQEAGWAPGLVWTGAEYLAPTGIRSPDRPARSESLYRLSYPGPDTINSVRTAIKTCSQFGPNKTQRT